MGQLVDCRIVDVEQGSDEWLDLRRTRITCSRLADVMAKKNTKRYIKYREEKVKELLGHKHVEETPEWATHGKENEPRALAAYEFQREVEVAHDLFLIHNEYDWLSCSPDLMELPNYDDGGEIKCRALYKNYRKYRQLADDNRGSINASQSASGPGSHVDHRPATLGLYQLLYWLGPRGRLGTEATPRMDSPRPATD